MMARTLWCLNAGCGTGYASVAGDVPTVCPKCDQPAHWSTEDPPKHPYVLSYLDKRFLNSLRIVSVEEPEDDDDGA
jgi:hypothetical protein